jgi:hypothetical protein
MPTAARPGEAGDETELDRSSPTLKTTGRLMYVVKTPSSALK